jgi:diguanylate cyclase (GGDEF)-like protein
MPSICRAVLAKAGGAIRDQLPVLRRHRFARMLFFLVFLLPSGMALAEDPWAPFDMPWFDRLGVVDGLPHSIVTALVQSQRGLVWIGTAGGLVRYDGYRMQVYGDVPGAAPELPDAYVRCLLPLPDGSLLVGTNAGGLARFDITTNRFHAYPVGKDGTNDRKIYALARDGNDGAWIATEHGLYRLDLRSNRITPVSHVDGELTARNFSVLEDHAGNLWLGNDHGLFVRTHGSQTFVRPAHPPGNIDMVLKDGIWSILEDQEGRLWVGSTQSGAAYRDQDGNWHEVTGYSGYPPNGERRSTVRDFLELDPDTFWLATDGSGVMIYSPSSGHLRQLPHQASLPSSLPGDSLRALMKDRAGNIWVASDLGVAHTQPNARSVFSVLPAANGNEHGLSGTNVRGIFVDSKARIWLGLSAGQIDVIDLHEGSIRYLQLGGNQTHRDVQSFAETSDGAIWAATQGLARISPDTLTVQDSVVPALDEKPVLHLLADGPQLMIATYDGVYRYDTAKQSLTHFAHAPNDPGSLAGDTVRHIERIGNAIWYLTGQGISIAANTAQSDHFRNLSSGPSAAGGLPNSLATDVATDAKGRLWIATYAGVAVQDSGGSDAPLRFHTIGTAQGLSSDDISAMLPDDSGHMWISLPNGISLVDGDTQAVRNLSSRDGLRISSYIFSSAARAPTGELLFGGMGGLTVVRPSWHAPEHADVPLAVTYAVLNGAPLPFGQLPGPGGTLKLEPRYRSLRVDFALLDYQAPSETRYSYRMEGFDDDWIDLPRGSLPSAIYTNLPQGTYTLHLRARTQGLQPHVVESSIEVVAAARWYETLSAMIGAGVLLLALLWGVVQLRTLYLRRQAIHLQQLIDLRTRDVTRANQRLDELASTDALTGLLNRRRLFEVVDGIRKTARDGHACIALLDLDRFKEVNDTYGHLAGDEAIRTACRILLHHCRQVDAVGRYGGEELMLCIAHGTLDESMAIAERIREAIASHPVLYDGHAISITTSIGVAAWREGETLSQWLTRADDALYEAKRDGRNRSVAAK